MLIIVIRILLAFFVVYKKGISLLAAANDATLLGPAYLKRHRVSSCSFYRARVVIPDYLCKK